MNCKGGKIWKETDSLANLLQKLVSKRDLYGNRLIKIPTPRFAVFYNGTEQRPEVDKVRYYVKELGGVQELYIPAKQHNSPEGTACHSASNCTKCSKYIIYAFLISLPLHSRRYALDVIRLRHASA